ncbi:hypothetical protein [Engelhardtia mirabilis]|uniref:hypothetical protein n=1 Tax=Engelhardtia mirabilis TaxID=2528011 RepID=UPI0011A3544D
MTHPLVPSVLRAGDNAGDDAVQTRRRRVVRPPLDLGLDRHQDRQALDPPYQEPAEGQQHVDAFAVRGDQPLLDAIGAVIPGFELVDEQLELDAGPRVDLIGVDGMGQLLLVLRVSGHGPSAVTAVLDVMAFLQRHGGVLCRHLAVPRLRPELVGKVVVLAEHWEPDVRRRLGALKGCGVEMMEVGTLRSAAGDRLFVLPLEGEPNPTGQPLRTGLEPALADLADEQRQKIRAIARRLERLDDSLQIQATRQSVSWFLGAEVVARVDFSADAPPRGLIPGRSARNLGAPHDVELFLDEVVASYVDRAELAPRVELTPRPGRGYAGGDD